jgi:uncharacterized membrane protein HdeD (DUF308 family)
MATSQQANFAAGAAPRAPRAAARNVPQRIALVRAGFALVWAAVLALAVSGNVPTAGSDVPVGIALLLTSYPLIDVISSLIGSRFGDGRVLRANAALSGIAVVALAIASFGSDAGSTLAVFGAWALVSGLALLGIAIHQRRAAGRHLPLIISGAFSTVAGIKFLAASGNHGAHLGTISLYMAFGAVLYIVSALRGSGAA